MFTRCFPMLPWMVLAIMSGLVPFYSAHADEFVLRTDEQDESKTKNVEGRWVAEGQDAVAIELADGSYELVGSGAVKERKPKEPPAAWTPEQVNESLKARFGEENYRGLCDKPYVIGLILAEELPKTAEVRASAFLKKAAKFFKTVESVVEKFFNDARIPLHEPTHPLVVLIFETDDKFMDFLRAETGGRGLSAENVLGFYYARSNHLVLRMSECDTFSVPLHEAVHQQVHNRGVIQRLAPVPAWFNEGIATGFEANGERIAGGPLKLNLTYARQALAAREVNWPEIIGSDRAFRGDSLAGEAYAHAWSLHWLLVSKYKKEYIEYVKILSQKEPLAVSSVEERGKDFREAFGKSVSTMQRELPQALETAVKKQKTVDRDDNTPGKLTMTSNLAAVEIHAGSGRSGRIEADGRFRNISTIRPMTFYITVETETGEYTDWLLPDIGIGKIVLLPKQLVSKKMENAPGGPASTFHVKIRSAVAGSRTAQDWQTSRPVPQYRPQ